MTLSTSDTWGQAAVKINAALQDINMTRPPMLELIFSDDSHRVYEVSTYSPHGLHARSTEALNNGTQNVMRVFDYKVDSSPAFYTTLITSSTTDTTDRTTATAGAKKAIVYY